MHRGDVEQSHGIIPARAGFTPPTGRPSSGTTDHPRSRGVYNISDDYPAGEGGSSPLARGLLGGSWIGISPARIIPARAGFTASGRLRWRATGDHPRSRGVYTSRRPSSASRRGSSPLARGLPGSRRGRRCGSGIIPARAGFTPPRPRRAPPRGDHPRSRGVYIPRGEQYRRDVGSSPLARGLPHPAGHEGGLEGIIPARAGFTRRRRGWRPWPWDHPRSRGVYGQSPVHMTYDTGSSPLARGLLGGGAVVLGGAGIIPARAGFTPGELRVEGGAGDHPRSRGVYGARSGSMRPSGGSSPLARGLR